MPIINYKVDNKIAIITLNRPETMNTFTPAMYQVFNEAMANFRANSRQN